MPFTGFTSETGEFLWELAFHNEKPWFEAHKEQFLRAVKEPFDALAKETLALMRQKHLDEPYCLHISRIYRDARRLFGAAEDVDMVVCPHETFDETGRVRAIWPETRWYRGAAAHKRRAAALRPRAVQGPPLVHALDGRRSAQQPRVLV